MTPSDYLMVLWQSDEGQYKDKCHLLLSNKERVTMKIGETEIKSSNCEKLLGIKIDNLTFNKYLNIS